MPPPGSPFGGTTGVPTSVGLLRFALGDHRFALRADVVQSVVRATAIAGLPDAPPIVEGVVNVRGTILPVLDVRQRFGLPPAPLHPDQHFIIAASGARTVILRVDRALDLLAIPAADITAPGESLPEYSRVAGLARLPDGVVVIHDLPSFLTLDEGAALDAALSAPRG